MPWEEVTVIQKREEFVMLASQVNANISQLCGRFDISRKTGYKWLKRAQETSAEGLHDRSRRPHSCPFKSSDVIEQMVLKIRHAHPAWGGRKIAYVLQRDHRQEVAPSTVTSILHRHQLISPAASIAATPWQRFERAAPNELWQMDFKGHFAMVTGRCHPLTVIDDHSRYSLVLRACDNEQRTTVEAQLRWAFERYGLPRQINVDNGSPWGTAGQEKLTGLGVWLIRLGIQLSHSRPFHPQTNGKDERFHRSLKAEVLAQRQFKDLQHVQTEFDCWRMIYNCERPHEALSMQTPAQRYSPSQRPFNAVLPDIDYAQDDIVRKVQQQGWIHFKGHQIRTSRALIGQPVALRQRMDKDAVYDIYFCHQYIDSIDLTTLKNAF